jgi:long-chain fatty acid transport protein
MRRVGAARPKEDDMSEKRNTRVLPILAAVAGLATQNAAGAGFYLAEVGTPASLGTGGVANPTNTGHADAAWTNPAGMTGLEGDSIVAGLQLVAPKMEFDSSIATGGGKDGGNAGKTAVIPSFFYVRKLTDETRFGISLVAPQGGGVDYGSDFVGRYQTSKASLAAVGISPSFAYKLSDRLSLGAGISFIYTTFEQNVALNQGALVPGAPDGKVKIENATDWGYQPFLGLTAQLTDRALLGIVYRAEADVDLDGDLNFRNLVIPQPAADDININWDNPQWLEAGVRYRLSDRNQLFVNAGWQDWSAFGEKNEISADGRVVTLDRQWDDTWHAGIAFSHVEAARHGYSVGFSYESSPVDDKNRTFDLPVDEFYKLSAAYGWKGNRQLDFALGATLYLVGDAKIDLTAQGVRAAGEFDSNYVVFLGGSARYRF